jgi:hypothetical protein
VYGQRASFGIGVAAAPAKKEHITMKKTLPIFAFLICLIAITSGAAEGQNLRKTTVQASVPYDFVVANRVLPAGVYVFELATGSPKSSDQAAVLVVRNYERRLYVAVATGVENDSNAHLSPKLVFVRSGDRVYLSKFWRQGETAGLTVPTPTNSGGEQQSEFLTLNATTVGGV